MTSTEPIVDDPADIVAAEIEQHQVLGALLRVGEQALRMGAVLRRRRAARPRAGDRPDRHLAVAHPHEDLGRRADDLEVLEVEVAQERRRVDAPQRAVEREGGQREGASRSAATARPGRRRRRGCTPSPARPWRELVRRRVRDRRLEARSPPGSVRSSRGRGRSSATGDALDARERALVGGPAPGRRPADARA